MSFLELPNGLFIEKDEYWGDDRVVSEWRHPEYKKINLDRLRICEERIKWNLG